MNQQKVYNFTTPQKQSPAAIFLAIFKTASQIIRQFFLPILFFLFLGRKSENSEMYYSYAFIVFSVFSIVSTALNYFKTIFYINGSEFIIETGVLSKKHISIPFERIQSINFEQNILHRILKVKRIKIDTAGSGEKEVELEALEDERAEALRSLLISKKEDILDSTISEENKDQVSTQYEVEEEIMSLSFMDLIKAGLFENHLKSGGLILIAFFYLYRTINEAGLDAEEYIEKASPILYGLYMTILAILAFILFSIGVSLVRTILKYFNLKFNRIKNGFKIKQGLFNTITISALDNKIQSFGWSDNLIKKIIGIYDVKLKQATTETAKVKESITIPGASDSHIQQVFGFLFPNQSMDVNFKKVHISYRNRSLAFSSIIPLALLITSYFVSSWYLFALAIFLLLLLPLLVLLHYKKLAYGFNHELIRLKGGAFGDKNIITYIHKLQHITKTQSPFQRKRGLVSLHLRNASGEEVIPYINEDEANHIMNLFLKKVETDKRSWI